MLSWPPTVRIFLGAGPTDMRKGFDSLAHLVESALTLDPLSGYLFVFRSRRGDRIKILYWDRDGLAVWAKRLESGRFVWPPIVDGKMVLTPAQLTLLIEAMDWRRTVAAEVPRKPVAVG